MTDSKSHRTTITLEPGQVAIVLGMEGEEMNSQLFASPDIDATLDDDVFRRGIGTPVLG
jgi:hypothetical protein